jgi:hypothetical protein
MMPHCQAFILKLQETETIKFFCDVGGFGYFSAWSARWIVPWADSETEPAICHCIERVVDRRFGFEAEDKVHGK